jgi:hypothetical protein
MNQTFHLETPLYNASEIFSEFERNGYHFRFIDVSKIIENIIKQSPNEMSYFDVLEDIIYPKIRDMLLESFKLYYSNNRTVSIVNNQIPEITMSTLIESTRNNVSDIAPFRKISMSISPHIYGIAVFLLHND